MRSRVRLWQKAACFLLTLSLFWSFDSVLFAEESTSSQSKNGTVRSAMSGMASSFAQLQAELLDRKSFSKGENEEKVAKLIDELRSGFHNVWDLDQKWKSLPGIDSRLLVLKRSLDEAHAEYKGGERKLALWRLRSISSNCVACHIQTQGKSFLSHQEISIPDKSPFVQAEFALIFKDFDKAAQLYEQVIRTTSDYRLRVDALWKWILVVSKYQQDPVRGLDTLKELSRAKRWKAYEKSLLENWQRSFKAWQKRQKVTPSPRNWAHELYDRRLDEEKDFEEGITVVDLLFLAGGLEDVLADPKLNSQERADTYLMLGHVYSKLSPGLANQFPDTYYELCIRELPGSVIARSCYHGFQRLMDFSYSVHATEARMPAAVEAEMETLHDLAFGPSAKH